MKKEFIKEELMDSSINQLKKMDTKMIFRNQDVQIQISVRIFIRIRLQKRTLILICIRLDFEFSYPWSISGYILRYLYSFTPPTIYTYNLYTIKIV